MAPPLRTTYLVIVDLFEVWSKQHYGNVLVNKFGKKV